MANVESQAIIHTDTNARVQMTSTVTPQPRTPEAQYQSRIAGLWTVLHTSLLEKWIHPTPSALPPQEVSSKKSRIAQTLYNAYKIFKLLSVGDINPIIDAKPNRVQKKHNNCYVLFLVWEKDNIGGALTEADALKGELEKRWGFWGDVYKIPFVEEVTAQQKVVEKAINTFIEHRDGNSNLLLVHYGGHGGLNGRDEYVLQQPNNGNLHEVKLKPIRERLQECKADVGIFLDSCFSEYGIYRNVEPHTVEILAACAEKNMAVGVSQRSFTNGIIRVLHRQEEAFNMHELPEKLAKLPDPKLESKPVHHPLKLSVWGSIEFQPGNGGQVKYPNVQPLFL